MIFEPLHKIDWANFGFGIFSSKKPNGCEIAVCFGFWEVVWKIEHPSRLVAARMLGKTLEFYSGAKERLWTTDVAKAKSFDSVADVFREVYFIGGIAWGIFAIDRYCSTEQIERELFDVKDGLK